MINDLKLLLSLLAAAFPFSATGLCAEYDLVLRNGKVIDGSGAPARAADVAVKHGRIAAIGEVAQKGIEEINLRGAIVAPGFIDVHTHAENIEHSPRGENFIRMGVTTLVLGNCGSSVTNVSGLFARIESNGVAPNVATLGIRCGELPAGQRARDELVLLESKPTFLGSSPPRRQAQGGMERHH